MAHRGLHRHGSLCLLLLSGWRRCRIYLCLLMLMSHRHGFLVNLPGGDMSTKKTIELALDPCDRLVWKGACVRGMILLVH